MLDFKEEVEMFHVEEHFLCHSLQIAYALVGSTAVTYGIPILTGNSKYYKVMKDVQVNRFMHK